MKKNANGISPVLALILTVLVCAFTVWLFMGHHYFWGVVFAIITIDFCADLILSFQRA